MNALNFHAPVAGRLDALVKHGSDLSNSRARAAIETGKVFVAGDRRMDPSLYVPEGTHIELRPNAPDPARTEPMGLRLVFRDEHLLVVDKPAGLLSAPLPEGDEASALTAAYKLSRGADRPRNVHRLDKETSGLLIFARTVEAARRLREMMDEHEVRRVYRCIVHGIPKPASGMISSMFLKDLGDGRRGSRPSTLKIRPLNTPDPGPSPGHGKLAITRYETVMTKDDRAAVEVWLSTGRTHQIRIHLSELGCPVVGERVYARAQGAPRQCLHAARLSFAHPITREVLRFESPWPEDLAMISPVPPAWRELAAPGRVHAAPDEAPKRPKPDPVAPPAKSASPNGPKARPKSAPPRRAAPASASQAPPGPPKISVKLPRTPSRPRP